MEIKKVVLWITILTGVDLVIKIIIDAYFLDTTFTIIPNILEFKPTLNDKAPYLIQLLGYRMGQWAQIAILCLCACVIIWYRYNIKKLANPKHINIAFALIFAAILSSMIAQLVYGGILDYIYLKPLFVFDLKDVYINGGIILFLYDTYRREKEKQSENSPSQM